jgi:hypothetical protein
VVLVGLLEVLAVVVREERRDRDRRHLDMGWEVGRALGEGVRWDRRLDMEEEVVVIQSSKLPHRLRVL